MFYGTLVQMGYTLWPGFALQQCRRQLRGPVERCLACEADAVGTRYENRPVSKIVLVRQGHARQRKVVGTFWPS